MINHIIFDHDDTLVNSIDMKPFDGIVQMLNDLKTMEIKLYLWTARTRHSCVEILKSHGLLEYFEDICCGSDTYPKPDAKGVEDFFDCPLDQIIMVGDSPSDIYSANNLGVRCISALWAHNYKEAHEMVKKLGVSCVITKPSELIEEINKG